MDLYFFPMTKCTSQYLQFMTNMLHPQHIGLPKALNISAIVVYICFYFNVISIHFDISSIFWSFLCVFGIFNIEFAIPVVTGELL